MCPFCGSYGNFGSGMMGGGSWLGMIFSTIFFLLIIAGIIIFIWWIINAGVKSKGSSALEILKKRYANGEISKEEYESKKKELS